jgi:hypothetical protein
MLKPFLDNYLAQCFETINSETTAKFCGSISLCEVEEFDVMQFQDFSNLELQSVCKICKSVAVEMLKKDKQVISNL